MKLSEIAQILHHAGTIGRDIQISYLLTDSRLLVFPEESLFFALKTARNDGHLFVEDLYNRGVRTFVISHYLPVFEQLKDAVFIHTDDALNALQSLAAHHRKQFDLPVVGITGSNGKTIIKEWIFQLLQEDFRIVRSPRSYNSQTGVPLSVWQLNQHAELAVFEAGISQPGEMDRLAEIIRPDIGIFSCIGDAHSEHFISREQKILEKLKLFAYSKVLIYCADHDKIGACIDKMNHKPDIFSWGKSDDNPVVLQEIHKRLHDSELVIRHQKEFYKFLIPFTDEASVENAMHCITLMFYLRVNPETMKLRLPRLESVAMRLEVKDAINGCILINDSYNSDLNSLGIALDFLSQQAIAGNLSQTLILSDILQSKYQPDELYQKVVLLIEARKVKRLIGVGEQISQHAFLFKSTENHFFPDTEALLRSELLVELQGEAILLKGSRSFQFEKLTGALALIVHETTLEVNLTALIDNLNYFRSGLNPETKVMCMVKAFAYGSGSVEIARVLQHHRVNYLAVAVADEGAELRKSGIYLPIAVMNPELSAFNVLIENQLEPEIYSFKLLKEFTEAVSKLALTHYPVHLKIDTGMHRLGFDPEDIPGLIDWLQQHNEIVVKSVFSHLAGSDSPDLDYFTHQQAEKFRNAAQLIENALSYPVMKHLLNSAGIERFPQYQHNMVRLGIGHYGISALPDIRLPQVCALKTIILQIKEIPGGETIGYSRKWKLSEDRKIAVLPIGYADGYSRRLSNGVGEVYVGGRKVPVVGNVSMDLITIDVTGVDVSEGDTVEIFGDHITISELAEKIQTIPYEILTGVSRRVKRVYYQE